MATNGFLLYFGVMAPAKDSPTYVQMQQALRAAVGNIEPYPVDRFNGRGIVICAGGPRMFTCAYVCIGILRRVLNCALPIEVWYLGDEEMGPPMRGLLAEIGAQAVDATAVAKRHEAAVLGGWELKAFALLHSRFREILLLDADNVPVADPAFLFDSDEFRDAGAIFWPDIIRLSRDNPVWSIAEVAFRDMPSIESGEVVVDKSRCWRGLALAHWMNQHSSFFYQYLYGDKDTFLFAWLILGLPYHMIRHAPKRLPLTLCQRAFDGSVLFQHRNEKKWLLLGINRRVEGFRHEDACFALLEELRKKWDGRVFHPPLRSESAREAEALLIAQRQFLLTQVSVGAQAIELLSDHRIATAPANCGVYWYVEGAGDALSLVFEAHGRQTCRLGPTPSGIWQGTQLVDAGLPIELAPIVIGKRLTDKSEGRSAHDLMERVLNCYAVACHDADVIRDFVGAIRTLAILDEKVATYLVERAGSTNNDARSRLIRLALAGLSPNNLTTAAALGPGVSSDPKIMTRYYGREN